MFGRSDVESTVQAEVVVVQRIDFSTVWDESIRVKLPHIVGVQYNRS